MLPGGDGRCAPRANSACSADLCLEPILGGFCRWKFYFESDDGVEILTNEVIVNISELNISELAIPEQYNLYQNTPNPFNPLTEIAFDLPERSKINLEIYDITGARVKILIENKVLNAGKHVVSWDAGLYSAGIYFYRIKAGSFSSIQKMILLK